MGPWHTAAVLLPLAYMAAVEAVSGRAVLLPPSSDGATETVGRLDGLMLAGGADLVPAALYGRDRSRGWRTPAPIGMLARPPCCGRPSGPAAALGICRASAGACSSSPS